ncbi:fumarate hydratase, partial [Escherichia coli]|nr:fumarate hydratase [Escherichia coli]
MANKAFFYQEPYPLSEDKTEYFQVSDKYVSVEQFAGKQILKIEPEAL